MRQIKFRAWDKVHKTMLGEFGNGTAEVAAIGINQAMSAYLIDDNWEIMQYTGLKDKNGVEIYEGDIVKFSDKHYEIYYMNGCFIGCNLAGDENKYYEVIGNIYENPELNKGDS